MSAFNIETLLLLQQLERSTKSALAREAGVSSPKLSKILNRQQRAEDSIFEQIGIHLDYPIEFFNKNISLPPVYELTYRHTSRATQQELNAVAAEYALLSATATQLANQVGIDSKTAWIDQIAPRSEKITQADIEKIAENTRAHMRIEAHGTIKNVTRALELVGIICAPLHSLTIQEQTTKLNSDGMTHPTGEQKLPVIGYKPNPAGDRERFTKAHELGHLILHKYRRPEKYRDLEKEAHNFAGAFLMPQEDAHILMDENTMLSDIIQIKQTWGISIAALISRGYATKIFTKDRWRSLYMQLSARRWRKNEPMPAGQEIPLLLNNMITKQYADNNNQVDVFTLEHELGIPFRYLDTWANGLTEQGQNIGYIAPRFNR